MATITFTIIVTNKDTQDPIVGATVVANNKTYTTNTEGRVVIPDWPYYTEGFVTVTHEGFNSYSSDISPMRNNLTINVRLKPLEITVPGGVEEYDGYWKQTVDGVDKWYYRGEDYPQPVMSRPAYTYWIGERPLTLFPKDETPDQMFNNIRGYYAISEVTVGVRVKQAIDESPIDEAAVTVAGNQKITDVNGEAVFTGYEVDQTVSVTAEKAGYDSQNKSVTLITTPTYVDFLLAATAAPPAPTTGSFVVRGVISGETGYLADAKVDLDGEVKYTNSDGEAVFTGKELGQEYTFTVSKSGYTSQTFTEEFTQTGQTFEISLATTAAPGAVVIQGYVKDAESGAGVADAHVNWLSQAATTDLAGFFVIDNAATGSGAITATASGYAAQDQMITTPVSGTLTVDFSLSKSLAAATKIEELPRLKYDALDQFNTSFAGFKKFLQPGSPGERGEAAALISDFTNYSMTSVKSPLDQFKATHSPVTPEGVEAAVYSISTGAIATMAVSAAASTLAEIAGLGQIESVTWWLQWILDKLNIDGYAATPIEVEYDTALKIPYQYKVNSKYVPMIPGVSDQIRFAVREAYPGVSFEDTPAELRKWLAYLGYSNVWSDTFWNAHWVLPSIGQLFEMRRRNLIDDNTLKNMIKMNDYHPSWIDNLMKITYEPARLVDIRTGYEFNVLTEGKFKELLLKRGYDPNEVDWVIESSIKMMQRDDISRIRTQAINQFVEGQFDELELSTTLTQLGIRDEIAAYNILEAKHKRAIAMFKDITDAYLDRFEKGYITEDDCRENLVREGMKPELIEHHIKHRTLKQKPEGG